MRKIEVRAGGMVSQSSREHLTLKARVSNIASEVGQTAKTVTLLSEAAVVFSAIWLTFKSKEEKRQIKQNKKDQKAASAKIREEYKQAKEREAERQWWLNGTVSKKKKRK